MPSPILYTVEQERRAIERALTHDTLGLKQPVFIHQRAARFYRRAHTPDVANVLVEKPISFPDRRTLFREFAKEFTDCTFINVGDDLGLEIGGA
jgi:hypothetical protein